MMRGPPPVAILDASSPIVTSRTQCSLLSGSANALLRRRPLRTVRATRRGTRLKQPAWAGRLLCLPVGVVCLIAWVASGTVDMNKAAGRPAAAVLSDGLVGYRFTYPAIPRLPLGEGVRWPVHVEQWLPAQRATSSLDTQVAFPGLSQLRGFAFASPVGPVVGQGRVIR